MNIPLRFNGRGIRGVSSVIGCMTSIFIGGLIFLCIFGFLYLMRSSDVTQGAIARVEASETAAMMLGRPVQVGWFISGSISTSGNSGEAYLTLPVSGSRERGTLSVVAYKDSGGWRYTQLSLTLRSDSRSINLLEE